MVDHKTFPEKMPDQPGPSLDSWSLWVSLDKQETVSRGWPSINWEVAEIAQQTDREDAVAIWLMLHRDERMAYRFNLSSEAPRLFVICEDLNAELRLPRKLTLAQDVAADYMDAGQPVLSIPMPAPIKVWLEAFMAHHGEVEDPRAGKRRLRTQSAAKS